MEGATFGSHFGEAEAEDGAVQSLPPPPTPKRRKITSQRRKVEKKWRGGGGGDMHGIFRRS